MWCEIDHEIELTAGKRSSLPACMVRLCPRPCSAQRNFGFRFMTDPSGSVEEYQDAEGNAVCVLVVPEHARQVRIRTRSHIELRQLAPRTEGAIRAALPLDYGAQTRPLFAYLTRDAPAIVECLAREALEDSSRTVEGFLDGVSALLAKHVKIGAWSGVLPVSAQEIWSRRRGNALDVAMLYVEICRAAGIAARLAQGYRLADDGAASWHAWVEIFLPDRGWIERDPSAPWNVLVPVAVSFHPMNTLSVSSVSGLVVAHRTTHLWLHTSATPTPALQSHGL